MIVVFDKDSIENRDRELTLQIMAAIRSIRYGHILITIHDSEVVQIDKTEKLRIRKPRDCVCPVAYPKTGGRARQEELSQPDNRRLTKR